MTSPSALHRSGFSLLEIVIAISVLAILAGVMTLRSGSVIEKKRVHEALETLEHLEKACVSHHEDTGEFAREYGGSSIQNRMLSGTQVGNGWSGPYLAAQLPVNANPWGGTTRVYDSVTSNGWIPGFDIDGDGTLDVSGPGNMVYMTRVTESAARRVNDSIDEETPGAWADSGRVRYLPASQILLVLVYS